MVVFGICLDCFEHRRYREVILLNIEASLTHVHIDLLAPRRLAGGEICAEVIYRFCEISRVVCSGSGDVDYRRIICIGAEILSVESIEEVGVDVCAGKPCKLIGIVG